MDFVFGNAKPSLPLRGGLGRGEEKNRGIDGSIFRVLSSLGRAHLFWLKGIKSRGLGN